MIKSGWEKDAARAVGVSHVRWSSRSPSSGIRGIVSIPCVNGHEVTHPLTTKWPAEIMKKKLQQMGWNFHGKPTCPDCRPHAAAPPPQKEKSMPQTAASVTAIATANEAAATAAAKAARREVIQWLEESFEITGDNQGRYKAGISDATIAKETGCAEKVVCQIREEFFGALAKPRELDELAAEIKQARAGADRLESDAKAVANGIRATVTQLEAKLQRIAKVNGWAA